MFFFVSTWCKQLQMSCIGGFQIVNKPIINITLDFFYFIKGKPIFLIYYSEENYLHGHFDYWMRVVIPK